MKKNKHSPGSFFADFWKLKMDLKRKASNIFTIYKQKSYNEYIEKWIAESESI